MREAKILELSRIEKVVDYDTESGLAVLELTGTPQQKHSLTVFIEAGTPEPGDVIIRAQTETILGELDIVMLMKAEQLDKLVSLK